MATGPPSVRPWRTPAVTCARSFSIFMRPPRPCPSCRRARSRSMSSGRSSSPAGRPSTIAVSPGPWDSPAVVKRRDTAPTPYSGALAAEGGWTALREEAVGVEVDELRPGHHGHEPTQRQEGSEGDAALAAPRALTNDYRETHEGPGGKGHEQRRRDGGAEVQPHHPSELDVAHPHPGGVGQRRQKEAQEGGRAA